MKIRAFLKFRCPDTNIFQFLNLSCWMPFSSPSFNPTKTMMMMIPTLNFFCSSLRQFYHSLYPIPSMKLKKLTCPLRFCRCLDSILHAEHKRILEEMRNDYSITQSVENEATFEEVSTTTDAPLVSNKNQEFISPRDAMPFGYSLDFSTSPTGTLNTYVNRESPYVYNFFSSFFHFKIQIN